MTYTFRYWYLQSPRWFYAAFLRTIQEFENSLAVRDTWRNLDKPLFQDYTLQGRIIGFFLRLFRVILGLILFFLISLIYLVAYLFWLLFPLLCLISLLSASLGYLPQLNP